MSPDSLARAGDIPLSGLRAFTPVARCSRAYWTRSFRALKAVARTFLLAGFAGCVAPSSYSVLSLRGRKRTRAQTRPHDLFRGATSSPRSRAHATRYRHRSPLLESARRAPRSGRKIREYAAFGVAWYWIVDPEHRLLQIHELASSQEYRVAAQHRSGVVSDVLGCPGLVLPLDQLWAKIEQLAE
jgi:hypothetical protein